MYLSGRLRLEPEIGHLLARWKGKCWYVHQMVKYEFEMNFEVSVARAADSV